MHTTILKELKAELADKTTLQYFDQQKEIVCTFGTRYINLDPSRSSTPQS